MLFHYDYKIQTSALEPNRKLALFQAKKMLPEYVFDTSQMENNPLTFPEVQILMDGITIGGHKISDVQQVLNIKDSWHMLLEIVAKEEFRVKDILEFNTLMLGYYETAQADDIVKFLVEKCIRYYD